MNPHIKEYINSFLNQKTIAIVGDKWDHEDAATHITQKLEKQGYRIIPIGRESINTEDKKTYHSLMEVKDKIGAVMVTGDGKLSEKTVNDCIQKEINIIWLHSALGTSPKKWMRNLEYKISSVSEKAVRTAQEHNIKIIPGGCPMMFQDPVDLPHKIIRNILEVIGCFEERVLK